MIHRGGNFRMNAYAYPTPLLLIFRWQREPHPFTVNLTLTLSCFPLVFPKRAGTRTGERTLPSGGVRATPSPNEETPDLRFWAFWAFCSSFLFFFSLP